MATVLTKDNETPLYNALGKVHGASPLRTSSVEVTGNPVELREGRGKAYRLVDPDNAYVLLADLNLNTNPTPNPDPVPDPTPEPEPTPTTPHRLTMIVDGVSVFEMDIL